MRRITSRGYFPLFQVFLPLFSGTKKEGGGGSKVLGRDEACQATKETGAQNCVFRGVPCKVPLLHALPPVDTS